MNAKKAAKKSSKVARVRDYAPFLSAVKQRITTAQQRAFQSVNTELLYLYWDIGRAIEEAQQEQGWGQKVIPRLATDLERELPDSKGFSERNLNQMLIFYREYPHAFEFLQPPVAKLEDSAKVPQPAAQLAISQPPVGKFKPANQVTPLIPQPLVAKLPWTHHITLIQKVKDLPTRLWYMEQTVANGWSRNVLLAQIQSEAHTREGALTHNFEATLPKELKGSLPSIKEIERTLSLKPVAKKAAKSTKKTSKKAVRRKSKSL